MDERSPFCPSCGTAQIRVSPRESSSETLDHPSSTPDNPSSLAGPQGYSSTVTPPSTIQWGKYLKVSWPLALGAGIATGFIPPLGFLLFLPIAVILSLRLYRKHHFGTIRPGQGALLGAALSVLGSVAGVIVFALVYSPTSAHFRDGLLQALNDSPVHNSNPDGAQALRTLLESPDGLLTLLWSMAFTFFCCNTVFTCLAGALAATLGQDKPRPRRPFGLEALLQILFVGL